ncbi:MAG: beta-galactosidase trimerization domain-containing protein, partial [Victivallales bacterium]|nr:beta-galactosidase trimerization domain-containing protein [Victivallales bacterium]
LTLSPSGRDTRDVLRELKSGIWRLIRNSKIQSDGIAIHYSQASIHAAAALGRDRAFAKARSSWVSLLLDVGLSFDFLAYAQIERGALKSGRYKVLILPESIALSDKEVREIREFVKNGGLLVADNSPGGTNSHCVPHATPPLDALFGVTRGKRVYDVVPDGITIKKDFGTLKSGTTIKVSGYNRAISAADATTLAESSGKFPVVLMKKSGKGTSVLMNMALQQYVDDRKFGGVNTTRIQDLLLAILADAGITPFVDIRNTKNERQRCRVARYRNGDDLYLGFVTEKAGSKPEPLTIRLNKQYRVIDVRTRRDIGKTQSIRTTIIPGEARLYTLTDASNAIPAISVKYTGVSIPEENKGLYGALPRQGGECSPLGGVASWDVSVSGNRKNVRVFHFEFVTPSNETYRSYDNVVVLPAGEKKLTILRRFALNDPIGNWKLRVRDIATGVEIEKSFRIESNFLKKQKGVRYEK